MILKYDEALSRAENPNWFKATYNKEDVADDKMVDYINDLVKKVGLKSIEEYFETKDDLMLQKEYVEDLIDYLKDLL